MKVPNVLKDPNTFEFDINNFHCNLSIANQFQLVRLLTLSSQLYYGYLTPEEFDRHYLETKQKKLSALRQLLTDPTNEIWLRGMDFVLRLLHESRVTEWHLPIFLAQYKNQLIWHTGGTRILATGMTKTLPYRHFPVLVSDFDKNLSRFCDTRSITTDLELSEILGVNYSHLHRKNADYSGIDCDIELEWDGLPNPVIHWASPRNKKLTIWNDYDGPLYAQEVMAMMKILGNRPVVKYYANDPRQLSDSSGLLDLELIGEGEGPGILQGGFGRLDIFGYRHTPREDKKIIYCWIRDGFCIDAAELLFWLNTKHNVYHDAHDRFIFSIDTPGYNRTEISMSHIPCVNTSTS